MKPSARGSRGVCARAGSASTTDAAARSTRPRTLNVVPFVQNARFLTINIEPGLRELLSQAKRAHHPELSKEFILPRVGPQVFVVHRSNLSVRVLKIEPTDVGHNARVLHTQETFSDGKRGPEKMRLHLFLVEDLDIVRYGAEPMDGRPDESPSLAGNSRLLVIAVPNEPLLNQCWFEPFPQ